MFSPSRFKCGPDVRPGLKARNTETLTKGLVEKAQIQPLTVIARNEVTKQSRISSTSYYK
jgi:hypothetical protein